MGGVWKVFPPIYLFMYIFFFFFLFSSPEHQMSRALYYLPQYLGSFE